ncbi:uncharacterized protein [Clytia hemisphaerica]|uniref:uncharacterized protein n=1 Tax=Clytia hemisphaerica TaxID=252671 RepID=UPI0034D54447|eukprot:TCONS_00021879-protein
MGNLFTTSKQLPRFMKDQEIQTAKIAPKMVCSATQTACGPVMNEIDDHTRLILGIVAQSREELKQLLKSQKRIESVSGYYARSRASSTSSSSSSSRYSPYTKIKNR